MIRPSQLREAELWIDRSRLAPELEALLRPTGRGRPRQLSIRTLLIGIKLAIDTQKTACFTDVHRLLVDNLQHRDQVALGVLNDRTGDLVSLHQVRRLFSSLANKLDPSPHRHPTLTPDEAVTRAAHLQAVLDRLLDATMTSGFTHHGAYAVDGTGVWAWARGKRRSDRTADPDAHWGSKTAKRGGQETYYGFEVHAVVRINSAFQQRADVPCLAERIVVVPAASNAVDAVLPSIEALQERAAGAIRELVADRGYSYKTKWGPALRALGIAPVLDLHPNQYGPRGTHHGARIITGVPHCPATPPGLNTITRPDRLANTPEVDEFVHAVERREQWAFRRINTADASGKERYECPARAGKLRCPLVQASLRKPRTRPTVIGAPGTNEAPRCCTQRTITLPGDVDAKARQDHYWGTRKWINAYTRRNRTEGWFGNLKNSNTEGLDRGSFRVMGIAKTSLMVGIYAAATNLRLLRIWSNRTAHGDTDNNPTAAPPPLTDTTTDVAGDNWPNGPPANTELD